MQYRTFGRAKCLKCRKCELKCPQGFPITDLLQEIDSYFKSR